MQSFYFHTGQHLILDSVVYMVQRILENKDVILQRKSDLGLINRSKSELVEAYGAGVLKFLFKDGSGLEGNTNIPTKLRSLDSFTAEQQREALRKQSYIRLAVKTFGEEPCHQKLKGYIDLFADSLKDPNPPSSITLYRWWISWVKSGRDIVSLITRQKGRVSSYSKQYRELLYEVIDEVLMTPEYGSRQDAFDLFKVKLNELNSIRSDPLRMPSQATFYRLLKSLIDPQELTAARHGKRAAEMEFRVSGKGIKSTRILERVEIDHTPIDLMVVDERIGEAIVRPTLTMIIDHYSRMPLGFYLGFEPPSSVAVMRAIRHAVMPKSYVKGDYPDFENGWPAYGIFWVLVCDNGSEFHDHQFQRMASELNVELFYCPKQHPYYKGVVERFLGSLNRAVCHSASGSTRSNIQQRKNYDSVEEASITLEKLRRLIHDWIINIYIRKYHEGLGDSPLNVWMKGLQHVEPTLPLSRERLDLILTKEFARRINHEGVSFFRLKYNSYELGLLRRQLSEKTSVKVRIDPENLGQVWVFDEREGSFFSVPCIDPEYAEGLSQRQHMHILKNREDTRKALDTDELLQSKVRFNREVRGASKAKGVRKRTKAAQLSQLPIVDADQLSSPKVDEQLPLMDMDELDEFEMDWRAE
jgi:putative transposase